MDSPVAGKSCGNGFSVGEFENLREYFWKGKEGVIAFLKMKCDRISLALKLL
jgi:hypothetical protein